MRLLVIAFLSLLLLALHAGHKNVLQELLFILTVDQLISAPFEDGGVEMRHELSEQQARDASWHFGFQYLCSVASAWHEALGHCIPVALVGCAACMSEA